MSKHLSPKRYRRIWEACYGLIPRDNTGRSYEIHHIDGNHNNNDVSNFKLVTIQEHYDIHYSQCDWGACFMMGERMKLSFATLSTLSSKCQLARVVSGTHHWQGSDNNEKMIADGIHPFLDKAAARDRNLKRVNAGTHNLLKRADGSSQASDMVACGRHHFITNNPVNKSISSGTHASMIKLSCIFCQKQCSKNNFNKLHKDCRF